MIVPIIVFQAPVRQDNAISVLLALAAMRDKTATLLHFKFADNVCAARRVVSYFFRPYVARPAVAARVSKIALVGGFPVHIHVQPPVAKVLETLVRIPAIVVVDTVIMELVLTV